MTTNCDELTCALTCPAPQALKESAAILHAALRQLEEYWLAPRAGGAADAPAFVGGAAAVQRPSIADLVLAAETAQLLLLPNGEGEALLAAWPRVVAWLSAVEAATAPHWSQCNAAARAAVAALRAPQAKL